MWHWEEIIREKCKFVCGDGLCHDHVFIGRRCKGRSCIFICTTITDGKVSGDKAMNSLVVMFLSVVASWKTQCTGAFSHGGAIFAGLFVCIRLVLYCVAPGGILKWDIWESCSVLVGQTVLQPVFLLRNQMNIYTTLGVQSSSLFITYDLVASNTVFRTMLGEQMVHETMTSCSCHWQSDTSWWATP